MNPDGVFVWISPRADLRLIPPTDLGTIQVSFPAYLYLGFSLHVSSISSLRPTQIEYTILSLRFFRLEVLRVSINPDTTNSSLRPCMRLSS